VLLHWLNTQSVPIDCENHEHYLQSAFTLLEQVPTQRHWFIRNQWYDFVELLFDQRCLAPDESECQFAPLPVADNTAVLTVQLQPLPEIAQE